MDDLRKRTTYLPTGNSPWGVLRTSLQMVLGGRAEHQQVPTDHLHTVPAYGLFVTLNTFQKSRFVMAIFLQSTNCHL